MNEETTQNDALEAKRGPGRPAKTAESDAPVVKKGKRSWQPSNILDVFNKEEGFRYRIIEKSPRNIAKKEREGWEIISGFNKGGTGNAGGTIESGKPMTSVLEGHDYVIGRIPEELAQERDAYMNAETARRTSALTKRTKDDLGKTGAPVHGSITMEKRGVRTVIKD